jgi:hypothetical protein
MSLRSVGADIEMVLVQGSVLIGRDTIGAGSNTS